MGYFKNEQALRSLFGNRAFSDLKALIDPCCKVQGGLTLTKVTYSDLLTLIDASGLSSGQLYLITDFRTVTYIQFSGSGLGSEEIHTGDIEPMIVQAASASDIGASIISTVNPTDIINYSLFFTDREYDAVAGESTGIITYREDTINKNSRDFDFRNIIFRRWETVNGSGNYDSFTNTGNGYQDFAPYPSSNCSSNKIGSVLSAASGFGVPYWLDNTVFQNGFNVIGNSIEIAFVNTCQGLVKFNSIHILANNIVANLLNFNIVNVFSGNTLSDTARANVCRIIQNNEVSSIDQNTCNEISDNNFTGVIQSNVGSYIINNTTTNPTASISDNQVKEIHGNSGFTVITNNTGELILDNYLCEITYNNVNQISQNNLISLGLLIIKGNSGSQIIDNAHTVVTGMNIENNNVNRILNNDWGNTTGILNNNGNDLSLNNFKGAGVFSSNSFCTFYGNTNNGNDIQKNLFMADITGLTFVPTAGMSGGSASVTLYDSIAGNVEQILTGGVLSYIAF